jgi:GT2 family glycosyltransferase
MKETGVVIIGRNEGERLKACLRSVAGRPCRLVYVDSGSTDGSVAAAQAAGAEVVQLPPPFTAARARNRGLAKLLEVNPNIEYVQFIDGDVELSPDWLDVARETLRSRPGAAAVCGRLRERHPEHSVYNQLCDLEWDRPAGEVTACGGIAMMRVKALRRIGGFRDALIAGEEPELCLRLRREGWRIVRLDAPMGWHDAEMQHFEQWWRRSARSGHAYAQGAWLHGRSADRYCVRQLGSIVAWAAGLPLAALVAAPFTKGASLLLLGIYPVQWVRIYVKERRRGRSSANARLIATFTPLGKFAQLHGAARFALDTVRGRASGLIEYKGIPAEPGPSPIGAAVGR